MAWAWTYTTVSPVVNLEKDQRKDIIQYIWIYCMNVLYEYVYEYKYKKFETLN